MGYSKEILTKWKKIEVDDEVPVICFVPKPTYKTYPFNVRFYPRTSLLVVTEAGKHFDDHAAIQFTAVTFSDAESILDHIINILTI